MRHYRRVVREIHRRSLWQVTAVFLGSSWAVLQVVDLFIERGLVPEWTFTGALLLLLIGLPIVLATAFVQEGGPGAEEPDPEVSGDPAPTSPTAEAPGHPIRRYLTWRNAILGGVAAFVLLGIGTAAYMLSRSLGLGPVGTLMARGIMEEREPLLVADFGSPSGDSVLAGVVTDALSVDLSQSPAVRVLSEESIGQSLGRMGLDPGSRRLDDELARDLALREGVGAIVVGDVSRVGVAYVLSAQLLSAESGEAMVGVRETAKDSTALVAAMDELSEELRERIGESLRSIRRSPPLEQVTTSSLPALRRYSQALRADQQEGDPDKAQALLEEAIALDTAFAMAHRKLGVILGNQDRDPAREAEALRMAFAHRDRLTERERYLTMASYYTGVTGEEQKAAAALESLLDLDPDDFRALNNLSVLLSQRGEYEEARELLERALIAEDSASATVWLNLVDTNSLLGEWEAAEATWHAARRRLPEQRRISRAGLELAAGRAYYEVAIDRALRHGEEFGPAARGDVAWNLANLEAARGRLERAEAHRLTSSSLALGQDAAPLWALFDLLDLASIDIHVRGRPGEGHSSIAAALERVPLQELPVENRPFLLLARMYAESGRADDARPMLMEYDRAVPEEVRARQREEREWTEAVVAAAEGRFDDGIMVLRRQAREPGTSWWVNLTLGDAYHRAGQADSARAAYRRYLEEPGMDRYYADWLHRARVLERLAELHDAAGDVDEAIRYYTMFTAQWTDADPELQPRVQRARTRLDQLRGDRG